MNELTPIDRVNFCLNKKVAQIKGIGLKEAKNEILLTVSKNYLEVIKMGVKVNENSEGRGKRGG